MGRKKGSLNKATENDEVRAVVEDVTPNAAPQVETKRSRKEYVPADPNWILTETIKGTPIAIVSRSEGKGNINLMVIPHYKEKNYKMIISSTSAVRPDFTNAEIERDFAGVAWGTVPVTFIAPRTE